MQKDDSYSRFCSHPCRHSCTRLFTYKMVPYATWCCGAFSVTLCCCGYFSMSGNRTVLVTVLIAAQCAVSRLSLYFYLSALSSFGDFHFSPVDKTFLGERPSPYGLCSLIGWERLSKPWGSPRWIESVGERCVHDSTETRCALFTVLYICTSVAEGMASPSPQPQTVGSQATQKKKITVLFS